MSYESWLLLVLLVAVAVVLAAEWLTVDVVAVLLVVVLVVSGILTPDEAFSGFASEFILILCCVFVLSGTLVRTGIMEWLGAELHRRTGDNEAKAVGLIMSVAATASAFLSNTNVTAVLMPAVLESARRSRLSPGRLLMPLAYASMLGGAATLIGTSTNLAAGGLVARVGLRPFSLFEFAPVGLLLSVLGTAYMVLIGRRLLPLRQARELSRQYDIQRYLSEIRLAPESPLVGQSLLEAPLAESGIEVLVIVRGDQRVFPSANVRLRSGDLLIVHAPRAALLTIHDLPGTSFETAAAPGDADLTDEGIELAEAIVMPRSELEGRTLKQLRFRQRFGVAVLAVHRRERFYPLGVRDLSLRVGDVLLLQGGREQLELIDATTGVWVTGEVAHLRFRRRKGLMTLAAIISAIAAAATGWLPLSIAMLLAVVGVVAVGVVRPREIYGMIEWPLIVLIGGMTSMGLALQTTGTADIVAQQLVGVVAGYGMTATMASLAILTMVLTQPMSNAAAALVMLPVAISTAQQLGVDPRSFAVLVTLSASLSFIAPLEPACLLVFAPGRYRFTDFVKVGLPMTLITLVVLLVLVPLLWPL